jgi:hypothetical protein
MVSKNLEDEGHGLFHTIEWWHLPGDTEENHKSSPVKVVSNPAKIQTENLWI